MATLIEKIRKARQSRVDIGGHQLTISRPTDLDAMTMQYSGIQEAVKAVSRFVVDWDLKEIDIVSGGEPRPTPFDREVFAEWLEDQPELWATLVNAIMDAYRRHRPAQESAEKKP